MTAATEERLGKLLLAGAFAWLLGQQLMRLVAMVAHPPQQAWWPLSLVSQALSLVFVAIVVVFTLRRLPARSTATGIEPRIMAIAGTFALMLLIYLPVGTPGLAVQVAAFLLTIIGTAASIYCLHFLGRSFAIVAAARELVTRGPYGVVRHPLYLAEAITTLGIILLHWSAAAALLGALQLAIQVRRMHNEEQVLRAAFPDYAAYAQRVPRVIPMSRA